MIERSDFIDFYLNSNSNNITNTVKEWCNLHKIEYNDSIRRTYSKLLQSKGITHPKPPYQEPKILFYDLETAKVHAELFWTGKQFVGYKHLKEEPKIITVSFKWLKGDNTYHYEWNNKTQDDRELVEKFLEYYNDADIVIGYNNDNFDNRFLQARAAKYNLPFNTHVRSYDLMRKLKQKFRLVSYSMSYVATYLGLRDKMDVSGGDLWDRIKFGDKEDSEKALEEMVLYNMNDVVVTEEIYEYTKKYFKQETHIGMLEGGEKYSCPMCGGVHIHLYKTTYTPAGTIQRIMVCEEDGHQYKISNREYLKFLEYKGTLNNIEVTDNE